MYILHVHQNELKLASNTTQAFVRGMFVQPHSPLPPPSQEAVLGKREQALTLLLMISFVS